MPKTPLSRLGWPVLTLLLVILLLTQLSMPSAGRESISYSRFLDLVDRDQVVEVSIGEAQVTGTYRKAKERVRFATTRPPGIDQADLIAALRQHGVEFKGTQPSGLGAFLRALASWLLPLLLLVGVWIFIFRRAQPGGGAMSLGRSQHKVYDRRDMRTTFADVAGLEEAVAEIREVVRDALEAALAARARRTSSGAVTAERDGEPVAMTVGLP